MLFSSTQSLIYLHLPSISFISGETLKPHQPSIKDTKETSSRFQVLAKSKELQRSRAMRQHLSKAAKEYPSLATFPMVLILLGRIAGAYHSQRLYGTTL